MFVYQSPRDKKLLEFISAYIAKNEFSPSYDEMAVGIGLKSKSGLYTRIKRLVRTGKLRRIDGAH